MGLIPGSGRSIGEGNGNPLQHSFLGNPMERGAWRATLYRVAKSWTQLKRLSAHTHTHTQHTKMKMCLIPEPCFHCHKAAFLWGGSRNEGMGITMLII